jgi:hypothetical protein
VQTGERYLGCHIHVNTLLIDKAIRKMCFQLFCDDLCFITEQWIPKRYFYNWTNSILQQVQKIAANVSSSGIYITFPV